MLDKHGYKQIKQIGEGSFGKALLVENADQDKLVVKMVDVSKASRKEMDDAVKEGRVLAGLQHPYVVRYRESFQDRGWLCIIMDYCEGGDLTKKISEARKKRESIAEEQILKWFTQAILALKYVHDKHILHRDLKPANFFLSKNGSMKMGDFGIAKVLACTIAVAKTQIGTPYYLSPELCQEKPYAWASDIWSMGCILYELCALKVPFDAPNIPGLVQKIVRGPTPPVPAAYSEFVRTLCSQMLSRNPDARPSPEDILAKPRIQAIVQEMVGEAMEKMDAKVDDERRGSKISVVSTPAGGMPVGGAAAYEVMAGKYQKGDLVEYNSSAHKEWLPARIIDTDAQGRVVIDLKPKTWITVQEQAVKIRPRGAVASPPKRSPSMVSVPQRNPQSRCASPGPQRSPSIGSRPGSRCASPRAAPPSPRVNGNFGAPGPGGGGGQPPFGGGPGSRAASPQHRRTPSMQRSPSVDYAGQPTPPTLYRKGDLVEYLSTSHKEWLPAVVHQVDVTGRIIIDLKPTTWITKEEQAAKIRPRRGVAPSPRPSSRGPPSAAPSRPGSVGGGGGAVRRNNSFSALGTPQRAPSPRRAFSREPLPGRGGDGPSSYVSNNGTPRLRPPALPPGPREYVSPLQRGGAHIAGGL